MRFDIDNYRCIIIKFSNECTQKLHFRNDKMMGFCNLNSYFPCYVQVNNIEDLKEQISKNGYKIIGDHGEVLDDIL